jgi:hypothetical protein
MGGLLQGVVGSGGGIVVVVIVNMVKGGGETTRGGVIGAQVCGCLVTGLVVGHQNGIVFEEGISMGGLRQ